MTAWAQWVEEKLYKVDKEGTATAQGVYRALSGNNSALTAVGNQYVALEETKEELSKTISSVDGKLTISDHDPTEDDGLEWPEGAIWETRDENDVALRRFIWVQGKWKPYVLGPEFLDNEIIDKDKFTQEVKDEIDTATSNAATAVQEAEDAKGLAEDAIAAAGGAINGSIIEYAVGSSETVAPTTGWSTTTPIRTPGTFIWMRTIVSYGNGSTETSSPVLLTGNAGADGQQGQDGAPGVSVNSIISYYQLNANKPAQPTTASPSGWSTDEPQPDFTKKLWRADKVTYSNGSFSWTSVVQVSAYTAANIAMTAADGKSTITYGTTKPSNPKSGDRFYNSANGKTEIYSGSAWRDATPGEGFIPALDIGRGTAGEMEVGRLKAVDTEFKTAVIDTLVGQQAFINNIYTNKIVIANENNLLPNGYGEYPDARFMNSVFVYRDTTTFPAESGASAEFYLPSNVATTQYFFNSTSSGKMGELKVSPGETYLLDFLIRPSKANTRFYLEVRDQSGTLIPESAYRVVSGPSRGSGAYVIGAVDLPTGSTHWQIEITIPAGVTSLNNWRAYFNHPNGTVKDAAFAFAIRLRQQVGATLIEPGAVTTEKVAANAITANEMAVGTITAASGILANAAVTNAKIANLAVTGAKIANATIGDAKIINLNAAKITAGTIDAARINGISVTGLTVTGSTIQTVTTANRGIKIDTANGLRGFTSSGDLGVQISPNIKNGMAVRSPAGTMVPLSDAAFGTQMEVRTDVFYYMMYAPRMDPVFTAFSADGLVLTFTAWGTKALVSWSQHWGLNMPPGTFFGPVIFNRLTVNNAPLTAGNGGYITAMKDMRQQYTGHGMLLNAEIGASTTIDLTPGETYTLRLQFAYLAQKVGSGADPQVNSSLSNRFISVQQVP